MAKDVSKFAAAERALWSKFGITPAERRVKLPAGNEVRVQEIGEGPVDGESMPLVDVTAATELDKLADELERRGIRVGFARDVGQVRDILDATDDSNRMRHLYPTVRGAVEALTRE